MTPDTHLHYLWTFPDNKEDFTREEVDEFTEFVYKLGQKSKESTIRNQTEMIRELTEGLENQQVNDLFANVTLTDYGKKVRASLGAKLYWLRNEVQALVLFKEKEAYELGQKAERGRILKELDNLVLSLGNSIISAGKADYYKIDKMSWNAFSICYKKLKSRISQDIQGIMREDADSRETSSNSFAELKKESSPDTSSTKKGCGKEFMYISYLNDKRICGRMEDLKHSWNILLCDDCKSTESVMKYPPSKTSPLFHNSQNVSTESLGSKPSVSDIHSQNNKKEQDTEEKA